jgi:hypothetical protein
VHFRSLELFQNSFTHPSTYLVQLIFQHNFSAPLSRIFKAISNFSCISDLFSCIIQNPSSHSRSACIYLPKPNL